MSWVAWINKFGLNLVLWSGRVDPVLLLTLVLPQKSSDARTQVGWCLCAVLKVNLELWSLVKGYLTQILGFRIACILNFGHIFSGDITKLCKRVALKWEFSCFLPNMAKVINSAHQSLIMGMLLEASFPLQFSALVFWGGNQIMSLRFSQ